MRTYEGFLTLVAELDGDVAEIERVRGQNARAWDRINKGADDPIDWGALGFTLHTLYGVAENYFLRVSKYFENGLPPERWHRVLLEKMALDIPGLRPALFTKADQLCDAIEVMKFRHRMRNLYGEDLDPGKTGGIQIVAARFFDVFPEMHHDFRERLLAVAEALR
jgi:hypothetical protein